MSNSKIDAIFLIGFGGPETPDQIRPFLDRVLRGRPVPPARYEEVVHHYEALGGRSPYNDLTRRLADALRAVLRARSGELPIVIGFRNTPPFFDDALRELIDRPARRILGFILSAFRCESSWDRYQTEVAATCTTLTAAPEIIYPAPWHTHPLFIEAVADRTRNALERLPPGARDSAELIFSAHSIPLTMAAASPYVAQLNESAALVANAVRVARWRLAYQSRSGNPRDPWLEPDIRKAVIATPNAKIVVPIGFLSDHVEVLYDLDIEAAACARDHGVAMVRAATIGDHAKFVELITALATT